MSNPTKKKERKTRSKKLYKRQNYTKLPEFQEVRNLKAIREQKRITQRRMSIMLGIGYMTYVHWECGINIPRYDKFLRWCCILKYNPEINYEHSNPSK